MSASSQTKSAEHADLLKLLQGDVRPVRKSPLYNVGLFLVTVVMILLPLLYVGLISAVGFLTYTHAIDNVGILSDGSTRYRVFSYVAPILIGLVVSIFMIKPLFARPAAIAEGISLAESDEPLLFAWIDRVRTLVGAPMPRRIDVNCDVNASAGYRRGLRSMFGGDLVLTVGLPLVTGLTLRQFTGVLAHEFGHFTQGGGMGLTYIIRSINFWFARVVYERDAFDESLDGVMKVGNMWILAIAGAAKICVWFSRRILWVLMQVGHLVSCFLLRQMEYDADRYQTRLSGSAAFADTFARVHEMAIGQNAGEYALGLLWTEKKLPDDLPAFYQGNLKAIEAKYLADYMAEVMAAKTSLLSTHPADSDRIRSAELEDEAGLLQTSHAADILFADFADVSRRASTNQYAFQLGEDFEQRYLSPTAALLESQAREATRDLGLLRFLQGPVSAENTFFPSFDQAGMGPGVDETRVELQRLRRELLDANQNEHKDRHGLIDLRLQRGLQLLEWPAVRATFGEGHDPRPQAQSLLAVLACLKKNRPLSDRMFATMEKVFIRADEIHNEPESGDQESAFQKELARLNGQYLDLQTELGEVRYPFVHLDGDVTCAQYAAPDKPNIEDPIQVVDCVNQTLSLQGPLYYKTLARLIEIAERAESAIGLEPLEAPPVAPEEEQKDMSAAG